VIACGASGQREDGGIQPHDVTQVPQQWQIVRLGDDAAACGDDAAALAEQ